jgi:NAD(P)-dependent dehydrogenase (short-subunit alcohol dehydrogenase family)
MTFIAGREAAKRMIARGRGGKIVDLASPSTKNYPDGGVSSSP